VGGRADHPKDKDQGDCVEDQILATDSESDAALDHIIAREGGRPGALLPVLHAVREEFGYIDDRFIPRIAQGLNLSRADVHGVVTFYHDFRRTAAGEHRVQLCRAEACQARGGVAIERAMAARLGVAMGATRRDNLVTLEPVYCLGLCASGPNALVDGQPVSRIDAERVERIARGIGA
jgi:formate dehydrogenase subunit gamma